jgi:hypothetical protein
MKKTTVKDPAKVAHDKVTKRTRIEELERQREVMYGKSYKKTSVKKK